MLLERVDSPEDLKAPLPARAGAVGCRDPPDDPRRHRREDRGPLCIQPRFGRVSHRPALRLQLPAGQDRVGRRSPGIPAQAHHRTPRSVPHHPPARRAQRFPAAGGEPARPLRRRARQHLDLRGARYGGRRPDEGRALPHRCRDRRWRTHRGHGLRGAQQRREPASPADRRAQRQRDVDCPQRRGTAEVPEPDPDRRAVHTGQGRGRAPAPTHRPRATGSSSWASA